MIGLSKASFFAINPDHFARHSPMPHFTGHSVYSDISQPNNCLLHFRNLLTPTKHIFDYSNRKLMNSKSSAKDASVFSNLKSLDISKSLEYN